MAVDKSRFTLLAFPQSISNTGILRVNLVLLPRNISPLELVKVDGGGNAPAFANVQPLITIKVVNDPNEFPGKIPANEFVRPMPPLAYSNLVADIYKTLKEAKLPDGVTPKYFDIDESRSADTPTGENHRAEDPLPKNVALRKYLPKSMREIGNLTGPRIPNAVTDDSYHCAVRDEKPDPTFKPSDGKVSWGKVYAHLMRQPHLAKAAGLIFETEVQLLPGDLQNGGWIYADILSGDYASEQLATEAPGKEPFIKKYAAKIPPITQNEARSLFAAVLFPVMKKGDNPTGIFDELFIEAARYSDGFAGLVHSFQPKSQNLLVEDADGFHPQKEMGIRLGWDDEQILIWYLRQLAVDSSVGAGKRLDAPLGVTGYNIDVREFGAANWESLNAVKSKGEMQLEDLNMGAFSGEIPYQVYPTKLAGNYWLPMYFANWNDQCMILPDKRAAELYANSGDKKLPANLSDSYEAPAYSTKLLYGNQYEFRIRMRDMSGGGPVVLAEPEKAIPGLITSTHFKRYVAPHALLLRHSDEELKPNTDDKNFTVNNLQIQRPLLGYPAVLYTGRYTEAEALTRLAANRDDNFARQALNQPIDGFGIPDMDVVKVHIKVEVETLKMDNLASDDGREHFITLYTTYRNFDEANIEDLLQIPITWRDQPILKLGNTTEPFDNVADNETIALSAGEIILPTARDVRITLRACAEGTEDYWGNAQDDPRYDTRLGKATVLSLRQESTIETALFTGMEDPQVIQGIYLQPDLLKPKLNPLFFKTLNGNSNEQELPNIVQRLASQLDVEAKELTLVAPNGERIVYWCSNLLRHTMAPDNSSITFSGSNELSGHWLVCTTVYLNRDWSWDSLDGLSFEIFRRRKQGREAGDIVNKTQQLIGSLDVQRIASFQAIQQGEDGTIHREYTKIIIIDVVDGKPPVGQFPDISEVQYEIRPRFIAGQNPVVDGPHFTPVLTLPVTSNPTQMPVLIGAGIALSPYVRNKQYSATEARTRYLWLEFDRKPADENDDLFARVLAIAPDQLISNNDPSMLDVPQESSLVLNPEYIRVVTTASSREHSGLNAMQKMEKSVENNRHFYILPLPPGLHHESPELFGFFTYEFRFGHSDRIWSTAQGRFGRPLRVAGLQHPAPNLLAMVQRDEKVIRVSAPFAKAMYKGRNVTSNPPRTSIWCLLYAQVKQADGLDYRNILLDEQRLQLKSPLRHRKIFAERLQKAGNNPALIAQLQLEMNQTITWEKESNWQAYGQWENKTVAEMLYLYGLPTDSPLSVVCVEVFGQITNIHEHINDIRNKKEALIESVEQNFDQLLANAMEKETFKKLDTTILPSPEKDPLKSQLGFHRILRTSPLTEVPFICCTD